MGQTEDDLKQALSLFQKKYQAIEEIYGLTGQMGEALSRSDQVSFQMLLKMRAEEMASVDRIQEELWLAGEGSSEMSALMRRLMSPEFLKSEQENGAEERIRRLRISTRKLIERLQKEDQKLNIKAAGEKSWYGKTAGGTK